MLSTEAFPKMADSFVLFLHVTSQVETDKYQNLLSEKGGQGFPYLVFMDADGDVAAKHEGERSVDAFMKTGAVAKDVMTLKAKAASGDAKAKFDLFVKRVDGGLITLEQAASQSKTLGKLTPDQQKQVDAAMFNAEVKEYSDNPMLLVGKQFYANYKAKKIPTNSDALRSFYMAIVQYGDAANNMEALKSGVDELKAKFGSDPQLKRFFEYFEKKLPAGPKK